MGTSVTTKNMETASNDEQFWPLNDAAGGPPLVYVVDDHVAVAGLVSLYLARNGFRPQVFHSSATALAAFVSAVTKPGLLIADFSMPEMDGLELIHRCKACFPGLKAMILTGSPDQVSLLACGLGAEAVLEKPVSAAKLLTVAEALSGRGSGTRAQPEATNRS